MSQETADNAELVLGSDLTMRTVDQVRATLRAAIGPPSDAMPARIAIDCSAAAEVDLTFIQLLIAARLETQASGVRINLASRPDGTILDTLTRGGFRVVPEDGGFWFTGEAA